MKFKTIFIVFNIIIVLSFLFIFFMPLALLGWEYSQAFWERNWPLAIVFVVIIGAMNVFFAGNWRLFTLLEKEDWPALIMFLEDRVYTKGRIRGQYIKLLVNTYMVSSNVSGIEKLEAHVGSKKPALLEKNALLFGVPHVLRNDGADMEAYFGRYLRSRKTESPEWIEWNYAFALLLERKLPDADGRFRTLAGGAKDPGVKLLSLYFLATVTGKAGTVDSVVDGGRAELRKKFTRDRLAKAIENAKAEVHIVILGRLFDDAVEWLYS